MTVYSRVGCAPCVQLKKLLAYKGIAYEEKKAEGEAYNNLANLHGSTVPLVVHEDKVVVGYYPQLILALV